MKNKTGRVFPESFGDLTQEDKQEIQTFICKNSYFYYEEVVFNYNF